MSPASKTPASKTPTSKTPTSRGAPLGRNGPVPRCSEVFATYEQKMAAQISRLANENMRDGARTREPATARTAGSCASSGFRRGERFAQYSTYTKKVHDNIKKQTAKEMSAQVKAGEARMRQAIDAPTCFSYTPKAATVSKGPNFSTGGRRRTAAAGNGDDVSTNGSGHF
mmetsp:Transcript_81144/g.118804  ORF Transcript_81144/g.118804 Transcript_81144/m.118804 type:complete len:170 (-) Transcript_81144:193-702(-)|eukprot:CAMPEP_0173071442 /NCGR_PEP_ID=MMETSP1102-20130122/9235_1 /TAXON_ID=49646 /ORGANISM="Geminigera sp., Strain Caron Lab Isolate" /LENGTH=169 /DNA_ID=CAMNT_0013939943 /DNA_START=50 /DNA_END=559 /DNA_ORIENTATION=-